MAVYRFNVAVTAQAENELRRGLEEAGTLLEENRDTLFGHFSREARLIADLSNLKAAMDTGDPATVEPIAAEYQRQIGSDLLVVTDPTGRVLAQAGRLRMPDVPAAHDAVVGATKGHEVVSLVAASRRHHPGGVRAQPDRQQGQRRDRGGRHAQRRLQPRRADRRSSSRR